MTEINATSVGQVSDESPMLYFARLVDTAILRQKLDVSGVVSFYLVNMLCRQIWAGARLDWSDGGKPLAFRLAEATDGGGYSQRQKLKVLGDFTLFMSGFFPESLNHRRRVDVDYYASVGSNAYHLLSKEPCERFAQTYEELADSFVACMDILARVKEQTSLQSEEKTLRIYEKWLLTGSNHEAEKLIAWGIVPNSSFRKIRIQ